MSGRRAKQLRRAVVMGASGDIPAQQFVDNRLTLTKNVRALRRAVVIIERRARPELRRHVGLMKTVGMRET